MKSYAQTIYILLCFALVACGPKDSLTSASAIATDGYPLTGRWQIPGTSQDLTINTNGTALSSFCDFQAGIGDITEYSQNECGNASLSCGTFPLVVSHALNHPRCTEPGTYICFFNAYRINGKENLILNCTDGKGSTTYDRI